MSLLPHFDALLETADHRDLVRAFLSLVRTCSYGVVVAHGHAEAAASFVDLVSRHFPEAGLHLLYVQRGPLRAHTVITGADGRQTTRELDDPSFTPASLLRSFLRQDPDVIGLTQLDAEAGPIAFNASLTGHLVLLGSAAAELESVVAALTSADEGMAVHAQNAIALVAEFSLDGKLSRVRHRVEGGELTDVARVEENGTVTLVPERLPPQAEPEPLYPPRRAPPLSERPAPTSNARTAFVVTTSAADGPHLLGTRYAFRPSGASWPTCGQCQQPLALIVSLDLAPLRNEPTRAQLFLCRAGGCDVSSETAPGVVAELLPADALFRLEAPEALKSDVVSPGSIELTRVEESSDDPLACDKLDGSPVGPTYAELEPLFQFVEGHLLEGGTRSAWDFTEARLSPGTRPTAVVDPNAPRHFGGDGVGALFHAPGRLVFRWRGG